MSATTEVPKEPLFVSCDLCVEVKTPALKTCLKCEISMCAQHLQTHLTTPVLLQTHPLTNPVKSGLFSQMASKCTAHGKLVEYYCLDDHVLVCMSCAIEEGHRLHNMKTLQTAYLELVDHLKEELEPLAQRQNQAKELERWHKDQIQTLEDCVRQLMETGLALKDLVFTSLQTSVSARVGTIQTAQQAISSALKEEDHFSFLQKFASVQKAIMDARRVDLKQGLESGPDRSKLIENIIKNGKIIKKQEDKLQEKLLAFADPEYYPFTQNEANIVSGLTFVPQTLGPGMTLSKDLKTLFFNSSATELECFKNHTVRFLQHVQTGSLRWFLSEHFDWTIGLCDSSASNRNYTEAYGLMKNNNNLFFFESRYEEESIRSEFQKYNRRGMQYSAFPERTVTGYGSQVFKSSRWETGILSKKMVPHEFQATSPWKIEVTWDSTSQLLNFYSRNKPTKGVLLCKLKTNNYSHRLYPFFTLENITSTLQTGRNTRRENDLCTATGNSYTEILCVLKQ
ncbi:E3 ubiquitin/ISG15 ligase TRIM25 [Anabarilius grahami]|uniref:E3 ubiquitin/ISG15 ligase TRIM25 n=1 Tax=Anabarilius grahami TaxID=495550 RepID=A0A3N0XMF7_ANAGA|nr:E3 ubiquitin/ISG15 ligase TRIM25 [Anabarilius grahami]